MNCSSTTCRIYAFFSLKTHTYSASDRHVLQAILRVTKRTEGAFGYSRHVPVMSLGNVRHVPEFRNGTKGRPEDTSDIPSFYFRNVH